MTSCDDSGRLYVGLAVTMRHSLSAQFVDDSEVLTVNGMYRWCNNLPDKCGNCCVQGVF